MSIASWLRRLRTSRRENTLAKAAETKTELPEKKRFSAVDIAGHSAAEEAKRLSGDR